MTYRPSGLHAGYPTSGGNQEPHLIAQAAEAQVKAGVGTHAPAGPALGHPAGPRGGQTPPRLQLLGVLRVLDVVPQPHPSGARALAGAQIGQLRLDCLQRACFFISPVVLFLSSASKKQSQTSANAHLNEGSAFVLGCQDC